MRLRSLEIFQYPQCKNRLYTSGSKYGPRAERVKVADRSSDQLRPLVTKEGEIGGYLDSPEGQHV